MKKFVIEIEKYGRRSRRLVPARDKYAALKNCTEEGTVILSCEPYTG